MQTIDIKEVKQEVVDKMEQYKQPDRQMDKNHENEDKQDAYTT